MQIPYRDNLGRCSEHLCLHAIGRAPIRSQELCRTQLIVSNSERFRHYVIVGTHTQPIRIFTTDRVLFQHKESFGTKRRNVHNPTMVYRTLRPAPPGDGEPPPRPMEVHPKGRNRVTLACVSCKEKRRKVRTTNTFSKLRLTYRLRQCTGDRPQCRECSRRCTQCVYEAQPGETRMASLKDRNERMKTDLDTMMELYWSVVALSSALRTRS